VLRCCVPTVYAALMFVAATGCAQRRTEVRVHQPMDFPHQTHVTYFSSGKHRAEKIQMHLEMFGSDQAPAELAEGRCVECHDDLAERAACAGCHVPFQNAALRNAKEVRRCVGCHRGAWGGSIATIPSLATCRACHEGGVQQARDNDNGPHITLVRAGDTPRGPLVADIPWIQINTMPRNVYFSHAAHVRYQSMACTSCHQDVRALKSPPSVVRVFSMSECLACHAQKGASTDCLTCHK
jgi:menaquinone reductase, multiheme cytochrome c subunit